MSGARQVCAPYNADCILVYDAGSGSESGLSAVPTTSVAKARGAKKWLGPPKNSFANKKMITL